MRFMRQDWRHFWLQDFEGGGSRGCGQLETGHPLRQERGLSSAKGMPARWSVFNVQDTERHCFMEASAGQLWKQACESCDADTREFWREGTTGLSKEKLRTPGPTPRHHGSWIPNHTLSFAMEINPHSLDVWAKS